MGQGLTKKPNALFLFALIPVMVSCATVVTFDVKHPPLVDLRNVNTITIIPFEWDSIREYTYLSQCVTAALISGFRWGDIDFIDPYTLEDNRVRSYRQFADVYITGRITNVNVDDQVETKNETDNYQTIIREIITGTAVVDIEYSYIRSVDNKMLGNFRKRSTADISFERTRYREQYANQNVGRNTERDINRDTNRNTNRNINRDTARRGTGQARGAFPRRGTWQESLVETAIRRFSGAMDRELGPWTTTERRRLKRKTGDNPLAAGYNAAILLAVNEQFPDALVLLERLRDERLKESKSIPPYIKKEIRKMTEFVNSSRVLEAYKGGGTKAVSRASIPTTASTVTAPAAAPTTTAAAARKIEGTVNLDPAIVYALNGPVSSIDDNSVFSKMVAYTPAVNGLWSMPLPDTASAALWLLVTDGYRDYYITKTALNISGTVVLDIAGMTKLN